MTASVLKRHPTHKGEKNKTKTHTKKQQEQKTNI